MEPQALLEIDDLARAMYRKELVRLEADVQRGIRAHADAKEDGHPRAREVRGLDQEAIDVWFCREMSDFRPVGEPLAAFCEARGISVGSDHYRVVGDALLIARMAALDGRRLALKGNASEPPSTFLRYEPIDPVTLKPLRTAGTGRSRVIFAEVAHRFIAERQRDPAYKLTEQSRGQYDAAFRLLDSWAKQPKLDDIDRSKASAFLDAISSLHPHWGRGPGVKALSLRVRRSTLAAGTAMRVTAARSSSAR
jgi:hypothetical protein